MKIIGTNAAPNPRRVRIFIAEMAIEIPYEEFALNIENIGSDQFASLNPMRQVPILVLDDGVRICETMAIRQHIQNIHLEPKLFGIAPFEKARVEMWSRRVELELFFAVAQAFRHFQPGMSEREVLQVAERGTPTSQRPSNGWGCSISSCAGRDHTPVTPFRWPILRPWLPSISWWRHVLSVRRSWLAGIGR